MLKKIRLGLITRQKVFLINIISVKNDIARIKIISTEEEINYKYELINTNYFDIEQHIDQYYKALNSNVKYQSYIKDLKGIQIYGSNYFSSFPNWLEIIIHITKSNTSINRLKKILIFDWTNGLSPIESIKNTLIMEPIKRSHYFFNIIELALQEEPYQNLKESLEKNDELEEYCTKVAEETLDNTLSLMAKDGIDFLTASNIALANSKENMLGNKD